MVYQLHLPNLRYFANSSAITQLHVNSSDYLKSDLVQSISTPNFITSTIMLPMAASQFNLFLLLNNKLTLLQNHLAHNYLLSFANWLWVGNSHNIRWGSMGFMKFIKSTTIYNGLNSDIILITQKQSNNGQIYLCFYLFTFQWQMCTTTTNNMPSFIKAILFSGAPYHSTVLFIICLAISTDLQPINHHQ